MLSNKQIYAISSTIRGGQRPWADLCATALELREYLRGIGPWQTCGDYMTCRECGVECGDDHEKNCRWVEMAR